MADFKPYICMQTNSSCYKGTVKSKPVGILWHSTGANNPYIKRYVQPTDGSVNYSKDITKLGKNTYKNDWNHISIQAGVNAFIGKFADDSIGTVQALPWNYAPWGSGSGAKGSLNKIKQSDGSYIHWIQFEICEDNLKDKRYAEKVYNEAINLTVYLCKLYGIDPNDSININGVKVPTILCHNDAAKLKVGTNHADINHWFPKLINKDMGDVRKEVVSRLKENVKTTEKKTEVKTVKKTDTSKQTTKTSTPIEQKVKVTASALNVRLGPSTNNRVVTIIKKGEVYTIVQEKDGWGKLKSGAGWIMMEHVQKI